MGAYRSKAPIVVQKKKAKPLLRNGEKAGLVRSSFAGIQLY